MTEKQKSHVGHLKKELTFWQIFILGTSGAIGTGILFSPAVMASIAGPGAWISWIIGGVFYLFIGFTYAELVRTYPEAGGPSRYVLYTHGWFNNLINSLADLIWYLFIPPIEALAAVEGISMFVPSLLTSTGAPSLVGGALAGIFMLVFVPFNYFGVKVFGKSTLYYGIVKLVLYISVGIAFVSAFFNGANFFMYHGGFLPFGFSGVFLAIPFAMFAFGGIRVVPDYAEESKKHSKLPILIILVVIGQLLVYLFLDIVFMGGINWSELGIATGNWVSVGNIPGNPFIYIAHNYNALVFLGIALTIGIIGPFLTGYVYLGGGSRVFFAQSRTKIFPSLIKNIHKKYYIPYWSLLILAFIGAILAFVSAPVPTIYGLIDDAVVAGYLGFAVNPVALVVTRKQGVAKYKIRGGYVIAPLAFIFASLIIFWSGWVTVSYAVAILTIAVVIFGLILPFSRKSAKRDLKNVKNSIWYILYILFMLIMTYIGSDGALTLIPFSWAIVLVVVVSVAVFFPAGVLSGLKEKLVNPEYMANRDFENEG